MITTISNVVDAVYRVEGGSNTKHPYGIMTRYHDTTPRQACVNTVLHSIHRYHITKIDKHFIYLLSDTYCPPSVDPIGNSNWKYNMVRILNLQ